MSSSSLEMSDRSSSLAASSTTSLPTGSDDMFITIQTGQRVLVASELDVVEGEQLRRTLLSAERLADLFPYVYTSDGDEVVRIGDVDMAHIIAARGLSAFEGGLNPDPMLDVHNDVTTRVVRRALRPLSDVPGSDTAAYVESLPSPTRPVPPAASAHSRKRRGLPSHDGPVRKSARLGNGKAASTTNASTQSPSPALATPASIVLCAPAHGVPIAATVDTFLLKHDAPASRPADDEQYNFVPVVPVYGPSQAYTIDDTAPRPLIPPYDPHLTRASLHGAKHIRRRKEKHSTARPLELVRPVLDDAATVTIEDLNRSKPGWRGHIKSTPVIRQLQLAYGTPDLDPLIAHLRAVPFRGYDTMIADANFRGIVFRSTPVRDYGGENLINDFTRDAHLFARMCPVADTARNGNPRGHHYASIMGAHRQYAAAVFETQFQKDFRAQIAWLMRPKGPAERLTACLTSILRHRFPKVTARMLRNATWHEQHSGLSPQFGLYWNFCINVAHGVRRVMCRPHGDTKNVAVFLCAIMAFWDDAWLSEDEWSWLVIWELGIILQCPRGAFVLYPSALLFHFNVRVVKCKKGSQPDLNNSDELVADGTGRRGSAVWFSQSTMFSCTNEKDQHGSYPDYDEVARSCFPQKVDPKSVS